MKVGATMNLKMVAGDAGVQVGRESRRQNGTMGVLTSRRAATAEFLLAELRLFCCVVLARPVMGFLAEDQAFC